MRADAPHLAPEMREHKSNRQPRTSKHGLTLMSLTLRLAVPSSWWTATSTQAKWSAAAKTDKGTSPEGAAYTSPGRRRCGERFFARRIAAALGYGPHRSVPRTKEVSVSLNLSMEGGSLVAGSA